MATSETKIIVAVVTVDGHENEHIYSVPSDPEEREELFDNIAPSVGAGLLVLHNPTVIYLATNIVRIYLRVEAADSGETPDPEITRRVLDRIGFVQEGLPGRGGPGT